MTAFRRTTLKDVAAAAGVHWSTVSKALRNHPSLPAATIDRLRTLAGRMGYRPDPALSALVAYRESTRAQDYQSTLAFVTGLAGPDSWRDWVSYRDFYHGLSLAASARGYRVEPFWLRPGAGGAEAVARVLVGRGIRGVVLGPVDSADRLTGFPWPAFSLLAIGPGASVPRLHRVGNHQYQSVQLAFREIDRRGYRRPGLALSRAIDERSQGTWLAACLGEAVRRRWSAPPALVVDDFSAPAILRWYRRHRPDVIIGHNTPALDSLRAAGIAVPDTVGFVNLSALGPADPVSGVHQGWEAIGRLALDTLVALLHRNETGIPAHPLTALLDGRWHEGTTLRPAPAPLPPAPAHGSAS